MELRNYQDLAINDIRTLFKQGKKKYYLLVQLVLVKLLLPVP